MNLSLFRLLLLSLSGTFCVPGLIGAHNTTSPPKLAAQQGRPPPLDRTPVLVAERDATLSQDTNFAVKVARHRDLPSGFVSNIGSDEDGASSPLDMQPLLAAKQHTDLPPGFVPDRGVDQNETSPLNTEPLLAAEQAMALAPGMPAGMGIPPGMAPDPVVPAQSEPVDRWLEEVRAQRQAWEERRRTNKEAIDARRRWIDPWGAAQKEARDEENRRRRQAFRDKIERERDAFRNQSPWLGPPPPWQGPPPPPGLGLGPDGGELTGEPSDLLAPHPPLPGWDNRWYFRGY